MPENVETAALRTHAMSVDVEDWYHDVAVGRVTAPERRVETNTLRLLDLFEEHDARATFFFLGEVAEQCPGLVRRVVSAGHEIGSHGYSHRRVSDLSREEFHADVARSLRGIEDAAGQPVRAYRAPYFSIVPGVEWPLHVLRDLGLRYDSSILATMGRPGFRLVTPRCPYQLAGGLWEIPVAVLRFALVHYLPLASGGGLRLLPAAWFDRWLRRFEQEVGAGVFYVHPWELDPESPTAARLSRWLLRPGRQRLAGRLSSVLSEIRFRTISEVFLASADAAAVGGHANAAPN